MSKRNSQEAKRAARERLRAERERQAKRDKVKRQLFVGGAVVAVLAIAGGIGVAVTSMSGDDDGGSDKDWSAAESKKLTEPANASGKNGTTVLVGGEGAKNTIDVYEDMRCPACASFEQTLGETVNKGAADDKYELRVHLGSIIDENFGGNGSKNAASALGAALDVSTEAFTEYKTLLYSAEHHPPEQEDEFADNAYLLDVAENVDALKGNKDFEQNVKKGTFDKWALEMIGSFNDAGIEGTPTVRVDGKDVDTSTELPGKLAELGVK